MEWMIVFRASLQKQMREFLRYPNYILKSFFYMPVSYVLPIYFLMKSGMDKLDTDLIFQMLVCVIVWQYIEFSLIETSNIASRELNIGIVEVMYTMPIARKAWILGSSCTAGILFAVSNFLFILLGWCIFRPRFAVSVPLLCLMLAVIWIENCIFCILVFLLNLKYKKMFNTLLIVLNVAYILSGVIYPVEELTLALQKLSGLLPFTYVFKMIRGEVMGNTEIAVFVIVQMICIAGVLLLYGKMERGMRRRGTLSNY